MKKFYAFLLAVFPVTALLAQAPGGVGTNLGLWLRADANTHSTDSLNAWDYFNTPSNSFTAPAGSRPIVVNSSLNFQPTVLFKGAQLMDGPVGALAPITAGNDAYSVFGVWSSTIGPSPGVYQRIWSQRNNSSNADGVALWLFNGDFYGDQPEIGPYTQGAVQSYTANTWYMSQLNLLAANTNDLEIIDQTNLTGSPTTAGTDPGNNAIATRNLANAVNRLGASSDAAIAANDAEFFSGNTAEVIVYNGPVSGTARNQIFSYLALKYGIHPGISLLSSTGVTIWDATANSTYNNSVFGLGMDNGSGLILTTSNSINTGSGNGVGQSGKANITLSNPSSLSDLSFLVLGNDNGAVTEGTPANVPTIAAGSKGLARTWKAQVTGTPGTVDLALDLNGITVTGTTANDFRLIVDNDGNGDFTDGQIGYYTPTSYNSTTQVAQFSAVTLSNNAVLGVLTQATPPTPLPVTWAGFTANVAGADVDLNWQVAANESGKVYEVEHATDGVHFTTIGQVANIVSVKSYSFVHTNAGAGVHYYRIHEIDVDGKSTYSKILSVAISATDFSVRVLSNPVVSQTDPEIEINAVNAGNASIEVWTAGGSRLNTLQQGVGAGSNRIRVPLGTQAAGTYVLKVKLNEGTRTLQILKF